MTKLKQLLFIPTLLAGMGAFGVALLVISGLNDNLGEADIALVLGNKVELDGTPSPRLRARLDKTLELYRAGYFTTILVSGAIGKEGYDEAEVMHDYLVANNVPSENIIVDNEGINTFASAKKGAQIIQQRKLKSVFVISQYFHIPRARLALNKFGVPEIYSAHANYFEWRDIFSSLRDAVGYVDYAFRTYEMDT